MPSSAASAAMLRWFLAKLNASSPPPQSARPSARCWDGAIWPSTSRSASRLLDARTGQQSAVAHHHHALQPEALLQLVDLGRQRHWIGGIAFEHLDRYRAAVGRAHQADDNLRPVATVVATVALMRQSAAASFEIGGGDIVEQQRAILQAAAGQPGFDKRLLAAQPV